MVIIKIASVGCCVREERSFWTRADTDVGANGTLLMDLGVGLVLVHL